MQSPDSIQSHLATTLRTLVPALVAGPDSAELLAGAAQWFSLAGGDTLFRQGTPSDTIFVVVSGLLAVVMETPGHGERIMGRVGAGEVIGEMGCITGLPRSASARALRSTEVLEIRWDDIQRLAAKDPGILLSICRTVVERMARAQEGRLPSFKPSTFVIFPLGEDTNERQFAEQFREALSSYGKTFLMTQDVGQNTTADGLNRIEKAHDHVVYLAERGNLAWTNRCFRQADIIVALGRGDQPANGVRGAKFSVGPDIPIVLVLQWNPNQEPSGTAAWIKATGASRHFHVRAPAHVRRVARMLTGNGFGLVLSGGGARGLAHLGVIQALRENNIEIDAIVGTSIGAIIGSAIACEWDRERMHEKIFEFIRVSPLWDLTIPRTSILAGRNVRKSLKRWFGDLQIEDMPTPYACVSANLFSGRQAVHKSGDLKTWLQASAALPGIFPPVEVDGEVHVDGGVLNNMPADQMRETGAGFVLGVDVGGDALPPDAAPVTRQIKLNLLELLVRVSSLGDGAQADARRKHCDILVVPDVRSIGTLNFKAYERGIREGYIAITVRLPDLLKGSQSRMASDAMLDPRLLAMSMDAPA